MNSRLFPLAGLLALATSLSASDRIGFYGIVEKVVFEPSEAAPERIQLWGAFSYVDGDMSANAGVSAVKRGYLYFRLRSDIPGFTSEREADVTKREWADLKAIAGTGQAIGFGSWGYIGSFVVLQPDGTAGPPSYLWEWALIGGVRGGARTDLRVRPATETPSNPATYQTETGIVKLSETGSHAGVVRQLKDALRARYLVTDRPLDIGFGSTRLCVAVDPRDPQGVWWWEPGALGCASRSTGGPGVFRAQDAVVSPSPTGGPIGVVFRLDTHSAARPVIDVRLVVEGSQLRSTTSGVRVGLRERQDLDIPEVPPKGH